jgi:methyltransferase
VLALLPIVVFVPMLVEARRAARHEDLQRSRGGIEPPGDVYSVMRVAYPAAFLLMIGEGFWRHAQGEPASWRVAILGLALFLIAKALKWWAILSLGPAWTFRVIVVPGAPLVTHGPYRRLRHPNYLAVAGELVGAALMTNARVAGPSMTLLFARLMTRRMAVEQRALDAAR